MGIDVTDILLQEPVEEQASAPVNRRAALVGPHTICSMLVRGVKTNQLLVRVINVYGHPSLG